MKIVNETCYSTEDLEAMWAKVVDMIEKFDAEVVTYNISNRVLPETLRIGYYNGSFTPGRYNQDVTYTSLRGRGKQHRRLGICKKQHLPNMSPLHRLATACNELNVVPQEVTKQIGVSMTQLYGWGIYRLWNSQEFDHLTGWLDTFTLRFRERAMRGSRAKVAYARAEAHFAELQEIHVSTCEELIKYQNLVAATKRQIEYLASEIERQEELLAKSK